MKYLLQIAGKVSAFCSLSVQVVIDISGFLVLRHLFTELSGTTISISFRASVKAMLRLLYCIYVKLTSASTLALFPLTGFWIFFFALELSCVCWCIFEFDWGEVSADC